MTHNHKIFQALSAAVAIFCCFFLGACASLVPPVGSYPTVSQVSAKPADLPPYRLQIGDQLSIKFYRNPELNQDVAVRPDGKISLPFVDEVLCAGLTPAELDAELTKRYRGELTIPDITVIVTAFGGNKIYVDGEVSHQGVLELAGGMTLRQALAAAGGITKTAHKELVVLIRTDRNGKRSGHALNFADIRAGVTPDADIPLKPYDVVYVPKSGIANANVAMELYIQNMLPVRPGLGIPLF